MATANFKEVIDVIVSLNTRTGRSSMAVYNEGVGNSQVKGEFQKQNS